MEYQDAGSSPSKYPKKQSNKLKGYSCSCCSFSEMKKSSQDFIKTHHLLPKDNKDPCFENGLVCCSDSDCDKIFLSDIETWNGTVLCSSQPRHIASKHTD
jgi:predicted restriction endonuclease